MINTNQQEPIRMKKKNRISEKMLRRHACALVLAVTLAFSPTMAAAASPTIPGFYGKLTGFTATTSLPVLLPGGTLTGAIVNSAVGSTLSIDQNAPQATIDWKSFNIAPGSTVLFNQKDTSGKAQRDWAALNRIYDANPSQIFGNLKADGKVYLINRNGILFGPGSQVDVHALIGSALNITLDNFTKGLLRFTTAADSNQSSALGDDVTIANHGTISTDSGGSVSLIGPRVENAGTINAPQGSVNMVGLRRAADGSSLAEGELNLLTSFDPGAANVIYNSLATPGAVVNFSGGNITADSGRVGLYGDTVQQGGMIRAVSAVKKGGEIFLKAKSRVTTDAGSVTESSVSTSSEKVNQTFVYNGGAIQVGGLTSAETYVTGPDGDYVKNEGALQVIEHNGSMAAPSGTINLLATDRIFMGSGSSIDVAGKWVDQSASANMVSSTLNSVELRDSYGQKNGPLKGDKIQSDLLNGSAIGDISGSYGVEEKSALERSTRGGVIALTSGSSGQIIVKDGATLNFSGGGFRYAQGSNQTTMVVAGNRVYDVSSAPQWLNYTLLDSQSKAYSRFGMTESFSGIYYGGGSSVYSSSLGRIAGSDAGTLTLSAGILKLDGAIHGEVTRGIFQTRTTADKTSKEYIANVARGLEAPSGGTLLIGVEPGVSPGGQSLSSDALVQEIVVRPTAVALPAGFGVNDQLPGSLTELSATQLSHAGLSTLSLFSNTNVMIESGARLALARGGSFTAKGRRIENSGEVIVPGGSASFILQDNITAIPKVNGFENPLYTSIISNLFFAPGSLVSVRGETIDNSRMGLTDSGVPGNGILNGGRIAIKDVTVSGSTSGNNLVVAPGATLDVSGGYLIDQSGKVNGGDAGSLELRAMNLSLGGELRGLALAGKKGGEVILHTGDIVVGYSGSTLPANIPPDTVPTEQMKGRLLLSQDRFKETGFTRLSLNAVNDITFSSGIDLTPSMARLPSPLSGNRSSTTTATIPYDNIVYSPDYLGQTSIKAAAGTISSFNSGTQLDGETPIAVNQNSKIVVERGAQLRTAGGGTISLSASAVDIAGSLSAPGGDVSVTARSTGDAKDLNLLEGGRIFAGGYNKPDGKTLAGTSTSYVTQAAGKVSLSGTNVNLNFGSLVDVSGSVPTEQQLRDTGSAPQLISSAGDPGSLTLGFGNKLTLDGSISGRARSFGGRGGTLQISSGSTTKGLEIMAADVALYQASGFDDLNFKSTSSIKLPDVSTLSVGRKLTLDTPILSGSMARDVSITSPWLVLKNTSSIENLNPGQTLDTSGGRLTLTAQALDITGNLQIKDFQEVKLEAGRDITFSDRANATGKGWIGTLWTTGNLTLQAQRIYPTTASQYTLNANGKITILPQDAAPADSASIYSAGGSLSIKAAGGIEQRGLLAAPMGSISLDGMDSRVYLAEGSSTITGGSTPVSYGYFDGTSWSLKGGSSLGGSEVTAAPDKAIAISGREVVVRAGATIDARGGGSITTALWQSGLEGSVNPFTLASRYVILPDNSVILPGRAIYLQGVPELGLKAGVYSILPSDFAFVPGALVIQDTGTRLATGAQTRSAQGYPIVAGYSTVTETAVGSNLYSGYAVRRATEVQKEGNFTIKQFSATDGGKITVSAAETAVIAGSLNGTPLSGGAGALFSLSGANVQVKGTVDALDAGFNFSTPVSTSLIGTMQIQADSVSNKGLKGLKLGDGGTDTVSIEKGSVLQVPDITLTAKTGVTVQSGAQVLGVGDGGSGSVTIQAPLGTLTVEETGLVRAGHDLTLNASDVVLKGEIKADNSALNISAQNIFFVPDVYQHTTAGLYLNKSLWDSFARYTELTLKSNNNMVFQRDVTLAAAGVLTLDAGRFVHQASTADVTIEAKKLSILNSGASQSATEALTGQISLKADTIAISSAFAPGSNQGGVLFDGFGTVKMSSGADLLLQGAGSITTPGALNIAATRLSATSLTTSTGAFLTAPDFKLTSGGAFSYVSATGMPGASGMPGGNLAIQGSSVRISGLIDMPSGTVALTATGSAATDGVFLDSGAAIRAHGAVVQTADSRTTVATPGGRVLLSAAAGPVEIAAGAQVDVAAVSGSDAGSIALAAPNGEVTVKGELRGNPVSGRGGSFA
ncbi:MAG: filamentous hemagglutinin N-terminal domain-containing protein, partial [Desulfuromonadales bacterium]